MIYLKAIYLPALLGMGLEMLLEFIFLSLLSFTFLNKFMQYYFFNKDCNAYDLVCKTSNIWDNLNHTSYPDNQI